MCIGLKVLSESKQVYWGRTQEFDMKLPVKGIQVPRNYSIKTTLTSFATTYAMTGISIDASAEGLELVLMMDGMNEYGLVGGSFYFGNEMLNYATEAEAQKMGKIALRGEELITWALANCRDIDDLKVKLERVVLVDTPNEMGEVVPQHYMFCDRTGKSVIVEQHTSKEHFDIHDDPVGTITNTPDFPWHLKNLELYLGLSQENTTTRKFGDLEVFSPGKGSGLLGLPGDFTPQSRFIRATILNHFANTPIDNEAVGHLFHILNTSDIMEGWMVPSNGGQHHTQYTSVYDLSSQTVNISVYENRTIQRFAFDENQVKSQKLIWYSLKDQQSYIDLRPDK